MGLSDKVNALRTAASKRWRDLKARRPGVAHAVAAYQRYKGEHGDHLAAAITYFSFLALFPLILLAVSVLGFVLASHAGLEHRLYDSIYRNAPGAFGDTLRNVVQSAISSRAGVGVVGLVGVLLAGLGWIANLRTAIDTVWGLPPAKRNFVTAKLADLIVLVGLGVGSVLSVGLTAGGTALGGAVLRWVHLNGHAGAGTATGLLGILLGIAGSMLVFGWLLVGLPDVRVSRRTAVRATVIASIGFEILKIVGTVYIARVIKSPTGAAIGSVVGILVWIDLVCRYMLYCVAWAATAEKPQVAESANGIPPGPRPVPGAVRRPAPALSPVGVAAGLVSTGVALGAASVAALQRSRRRAGTPPR